MSDNDTPLLTNVIGWRTRTDNEREWWSGGSWLYPGDRVIVVPKEEYEWIKRMEAELKAEKEYSARLRWVIQDEIGPKPNLLDFMKDRGYL